MNLGAISTLLLWLLAMKLTIERLITLTHQDVIDLAKIWPNQQPAAWQQWITEGRPLFAARFNERLLGAVKVAVYDQQAELQDLCVREVTRRRGVGLYLIEETLRQLPEIKHWYLNGGDLTAAERPQINSFMLACGFSHEAQGWRR